MLVNVQPRRRAEPRVDEGARRGEATIQSFSAVDLLGDVGSGSTAQEGGTSVIEFGIVSFSLILKDTAKCSFLLAWLNKLILNFAMNILPP